MTSIRRKTIAAIATVAALTALTACGNGNDPIKGNGTLKDTPNTSATAEPTAGGPNIGINKEKGDLDWCANVKADSFKKTGDYTPEQVADAYCELITFNGRNGLTNLAITQKSYDPVEISFVRDSLTNAAYKSIQDNYEKATASILAGKFDTPAQTAVSLLTDLAETQQGYGFYKKDLLSADRQWSPADYSLAAEKDPESQADRLFLKVKFSDNLLMVKEGKPFTVTKTRDMEFYLSPTGDETGGHSWLIDGWKGKSTYGKETPYKDPAK